MNGLEGVWKKSGEGHGEGEDRLPKPCEMSVKTM